VRKLREFNISLLGKWWWGMLVEREGLWYRVLKARYGEEGGCVKEGGRDCSVWWQMMQGIRDGVRLGWGVGLRIMFGGLLVVVVEHCFGTIIGWEEFPYRSNSLAFLIWLPIGGLRWWRWQGGGCRLGVEEAPFSLGGGVRYRVLYYAAGFYFAGQY